MSTIQYGNACPALLVGLDDLIANGGLNFNTKVGILSGLYSPQNRTADFTATQLVSKNGHTKQVRVSYRQRQTDSDVADTESCDFGTPKEWFEDNIDVGLYSEITIDWTMADVAAYCEAFSEWQRLGAGATGAIQVMRDAAMQVNTDLDALRIKIAKNAHTALVAGKGGYADGVTSPQTFNTLVSASGALKDTGLADFELRLDEIGSNLRPIVVGSGNMYRTVRAMQYGCCNDGGIDFARMRDAGARFDFFHDVAPSYTSIYGDANGFGGWLPNTFQMVTYNKNVGNFAGQIGTAIYGTMPDPLIQGLVYDIKLIVDECDKKYNLSIGLNYDFYAPASPFKSGDRLENVNGIITGISSAS